jgi:hypothetical protein
MTQRIRYIRPDFFLDEDIADLPDELKLFYIGMWTHADREGRLEDRPERLKIEIMPYRPKFNAEAALIRLAKPKRVSGRPYIVRYQMDGRKFIQILSWKRHQKPHVNEQDSVIPPPPTEADKGQGSAKARAKARSKARAKEHGDGDGDWDCDGDGEGDRGRGDPKPPPSPLPGELAAPKGRQALTPPPTVSQKTIQEFVKMWGPEKTKAYLEEHGYVADLGVEEKPSTKE